MKVYAITAGSYSDYHIVAITDDKEKAEAMADLINKQADDDDAYRRLSFSMSLKYL